MLFRRYEFECFFGGANLSAFYGGANLNSFLACFVGGTDLSAFLVVFFGVCGSSVSGLMGLVEHHTIFSVESLGIAIHVATASREGWGVLSLVLWSCTATLAPATSSGKCKTVRR